jgi:ABC-2 type transport system ATP-binding protein
MSDAVAISVQSLTHCYGERVALRDLSLAVACGEVFAFLGPNGGGKTTLFRLVSTLIPPQQGEVRVFDCCVRRQLMAVRRHLGVVFQAASLDKKLTVEENLAQQAALYGIRGPLLRERREEVLQQLGLQSRRRDLVETLSGGLRRRVDLAKALLHRPSLLLLDEPSTGLDPGARSDLWRYLRRLRDDFGTTIVLTSHLLDEADRADRVAILHEGQLVAIDSPSALRASLGGDSVSIETDRPAELCSALNARWNCRASIVDQDVRFAVPAGSHWWSDLREKYPDEIKSIRVGQPTLEDVFIDKTGHRFWQAETGELLPTARRK